MKRQTDNPFVSLTKKKNGRTQIKSEMKETKKKKEKKEEEEKEKEKNIKKSGSAKGWQRRN